MGVVQYCVDDNKINCVGDNKINLFRSNEFPYENEVYKASKSKK